MFWLALKTLFHEKGRLVITLIGTIFSTVLSLTQVSMYLGMMGNATAIIRHTDADIWITSKNVQNFDFANPFPEQRINRVKALPEVLWADKLILTWGFLKLANGGQEQVQIIGFNPDTGTGAPWNMVTGNTWEVKGGRYMIADKTSEQRLGRLETDTLWELNRKRFKLTGISDGIRSFTTAPVVFMSFKQARNFFSGTVRQGDTSYIVAKLRDGKSSRDVVKILKASMKDNDIFTKEDFIYKTVMYWTVQTGMGMGFFLTALLGLIVGGAIVGQTVYSNTMEHLREYGTLKALGARNREIYQIIFGQVGTSTVIGYSAGAVIILLAKDGIEKAGVSLYLSPGLFAALFLLILLTCLLSAYFSVRKVRTLDPVTVFRT
ncbi:MAG: FtsX-like permease family protein [Nitrospiraceae bacterium]|nr:MAG: FtsX-like permease family protein [Nitrospiraceae bacterium]